MGQSETPYDRYVRINKELIKLRASSKKTFEAEEALMEELTEAYLGLSPKDMEKVGKGRK